MENKQNFSPLCDIEFQAMMYAIECHSSTNHMYGKTLPYHYHLAMVVQVAKKFIDYIPEEDRQNVLAACWCHDVIEDTRQTYNDVKETLNEEVAELVFALTNEKGRNRAERGNYKYYEGIRNVKYGVFVKLCDRIANMEYSYYSGSSMMKKYVQENLDFIKKISLGTTSTDIGIVTTYPYADMIKYLKEIISDYLKRH